MVLSPFQTRVRWPHYSRHPKMGRTLAVTAASRILGLTTLRWASILTPGRRVGACSGLRGGRSINMRLGLVRTRLVSSTFSIATDPSFGGRDCSVFSALRLVRRLHHANAKWTR